LPQFRAALGKNPVQIRTAYLMAQCAVRGELQGHVRVPHVQHKLSGLVNAVLDCQIHVHDILVLREHMARGLERPDIGDGNHSYIVDQRQLEVETRHGGGVILAKAQNHRVFPLIHDVDRLVTEVADHQNADNRKNQREATRALAGAAAVTAASAALTTEKLIELIQAFFSASSRSGGP